MTALALIAFAANSVLCRMALGENSIDAASFTIIRLLSGALMLFLILRVKIGKSTPPSKGSWYAALMLFTYAITFSFAYVTLDTGTGALILFGSVQLTMIIFSLISGNRLIPAEWLGVAVAFTGFVYLVSPGISTPSIWGFVLMTFSGVAWGIYTLEGRGSSNPLTDTAFNFFRTAPLALVLLFITVLQAHYTLEGILLAVLSGSFASAIGYIIWYTALGGLSATQAGVVQLSVPLIAAFGGVFFIGEQITLRLSFSALAILGGIGMVILGRYYHVATDDKSAKAK